ncbi:MAG: site-specific integrase, partial [Bacteroidota bacterium]
MLAKLENEAKGELLGVDNSLFRLIDSYIEECKRGDLNIKAGTWRQYISHLNRLKDYTFKKGKSDLSFSEVNMEFYHDFMKYLRSNGCGEAGAGKHIKILKRFMAIGLERKLHTNTEFRSKAFHAAKVRPMDKIYLDEEEIHMLASLNLASRQELRKERDRFLVSYYMLLRYGDSVRISRANMIKQGGRVYYRNIAEKTGTVSFVPVKPVALEIIKRNNYDLSGDTNQEANRKLKQIAASAGIVD